MDMGSAHPAQPGQGRNRPSVGSLQTPPAQLADGKLQSALFMLLPVLAWRVTCSQSQIVPSLVGYSAHITAQTQAKHRESCGTADNLIRCSVRRYIGRYLP